jgi:hypothetical protein
VTINIGTCIATRRTQSCEGRGADCGAVAVVPARGQSAEVGVHSPDYPEWLVTEVAVFGIIGLFGLAATFAIVERRRPF